MITEGMNLAKEQRGETSNTSNGDEKSEGKDRQEQDAKEDVKTIQVKEDMDAYDPINHSLKQTKDEALPFSAKVRICFPHGTIPVEAKGEDTLKSILLELNAPVYSDVYYVCENRMLYEDQQFSETSICNGSRIFVNARLRGGSGGESSLAVSGGQGGSGITKQSLTDYIADNKGQWFEAVEIPEQLQVIGKDTFGVMLGYGGRTCLRLILECLERSWKRKECFRGVFTEKDIVYNVQLGIMEIQCTEYPITEAGFAADVSGIERIVLEPHFKHSYNNNGVISLKYPMYVEELSFEMRNSAKDANYFRDEDKRALIHDSGATMSFQRRIQIYNAIFRYLKTVSDVNRAPFLEAIDPGILQGTVRTPIVWTNLFEVTSSILKGRLNFNPFNPYHETYMDLLVFSRCVFEHGPTKKVNEKQCEVALYFLKQDLFMHFQRTILTVYQEIPVTPLVPTGLPPLMPQVPSGVAPPHVSSVLPQASPGAYVHPGRRAQSAPGTSNQPPVLQAQPAPAVQGQPAPAVQGQPAPAVQFRQRRLASVFVPTVPTANSYSVKNIYSKT